MKKSNILLFSIIGVLGIILVTTSVTYAFFSTSFGNSNSTSQVVTTGSLDHITFTDSSGSNKLVNPILDSDKSLKSIKHTFSLDNSNMNNIPVCSSIYLVPSKIGNKTVGGVNYLKYLKFELVDVSNSNTLVKEGDVSLLSVNTPYLLTNVSLPQGTKKDYELRLWLSYDTVNDQSPLLIGNDKANSIFEGNINIETNTGLCS